MGNKANAKSHQKARAVAENTTTPPDTLTQSQFIARVVKAQGNNLWTVEIPDATEILVELEYRFRGTIFVKRGGYVLVDTAIASVRENKIQGEILNVVRDEKEWRKQPFWPLVFVEKSRPVDSDDEDSTVGQMPPSDDDDD